MYTAYSPSEVSVWRHRFDTNRIINKLTVLGANQNNNRFSEIIKLNQIETIKLKNKREMILSAVRDDGDFQHPFRDKGIRYNIHIHILYIFHTFHVVYLEETTPFCAITVRASGSTLKNQYLFNDTISQIPFVLCCTGFIRLTLS